MANDWIKMRSDLLTHPKVVRMMSALKADRLRVIGGLHAAWCLFDAHTTDGILDGYSPEVLDSHLGWAGFSDAMIAIGWLNFDGDGLSIPSFDEHNGQSAKRRAQEASRKRDVRKASADDADKKRTREEKRREEKREEVKDIASGKPSCPHQEIIAMYHEILPASPRIKDWTAARSASLKARWNEDVDRQTLDYWKSLFEYIAEIPFLTGKVASNGRKPFVISLDWLVKPDNFAKVREGRYEDQAA